MLMQSFFSFGRLHCRRMSFEASLRCAPQDEEIGDCATEGEPACRHLRNPPMILMLRRRSCAVSKHAR
jgi:hypothetical protein